MSMFKHLREVREAHGRVVEARQALELSNHLSQEQQLLVEGQYQRTVEEWPKAVETYRSLFRLFPDNLDYGLLFASAQMHLSPADSLQTLAVLRQLPPQVLTRNLLSP